MDTDFATFLLYLYSLKDLVLSLLKWGLFTRFDSVPLSKGVEISTIINQNT